MRALTMPAGDFPYGNTMGLDSAFTCLSLILSLSHTLCSIVSSSPTFPTKTNSVSLSFFSATLRFSIVARSFFSDVYVKRIVAEKQRGEAGTASLFHSGSHNEITVISCSPSHANHRSNLP